MADGELRLTLDDETLQRLAVAAEAAGVTVEAYSADLLASSSRDDDWSEDIRILEEANREGEWSSVQEGLAEFDRAVEARLTRKR